MWEARRIHMVLVRALIALGLATFLLASLGEPAGAKPRCAGKKATIVGSAGNDVIKSRGRRLEVIVTKGGDDRVFGRRGRDVVCTGIGTDSVEGGRGRDVVLAGYGDDLVAGGNGVDRLIGEDGSDTIIGGPGGEHAVGGPGNDWLYGAQQDDTLIGSDGDDLLIGDHGNDDMLGEEGNDYLRGDIGQDDFTGGSGIDIAGFKTFMPGYFTSVWGAEARLLPDRSQAEEGLGFDTFEGIESVAGSSFADAFNAQALPDAGEAQGGGYVPDPRQPEVRDYCDGFARASCGPITTGEATPAVLLDPAQPDPGVQIVGGPGPDRLQLSSSGSEIRVDASSPLTAGPGCAGAGSLTVTCPLPQPLGYLIAFGGAGSDWITLTSELDRTASVRLSGGPGGDTVAGGPGDEMIDAGGEESELAFAQGPDTPDILFGGGGDDSLTGGPIGPDSLYGGPGSDQLVPLTVCGGVLEGGPGGGDIAGFASLVWLGGDAGIHARLGGTTEGSGAPPYPSPCLPTRVGASNEILEGARSDDVLIGNNRSNFLIIGHQGDDLIKGLGGFDRLRGDAGEDILIGGSGPDVLEAVDGEADARIDCGAGGRHARTDSSDPSPRRCKRR